MSSVNAPQGAGNTILYSIYLNFGLAGAIVLLTFISTIWAGVKITLIMVLIVVVWFVDVLVKSRVIGANYSMFADLSFSSLIFFATSLPNQVVTLATSTNQEFVLSFSIYDIFAITIAGLSLLVLYVFNVNLGNSIEMAIQNNSLPLGSIRNLRIVSGLLGLISVIIIYILLLTGVV